MTEVCSWSRNDLGYPRAPSIPPMLSSISLSSYTRMDFILEKGLPFDESSCDGKVDIFTLSTRILPFL